MVVLTDFLAKHCSFYSFFSSSFVSVDGAKTSIRLHHLRKYTTYMLWVSASTSVGEGPMSEKHSYTTAEDGKTSFLLFNSFLICGAVGLGGQHEEDCSPKKIFAVLQRKRDSYPEGRGWGGGGVGASPYIIHIGTCMCHPKGDGFWAVLV